MRNIKFVCLATILSVSTAYASSVPCDGFEVKIKNNLSKDLLVTQIKLDGATIQPGSIQKLGAHSEQVFTVNNSLQNTPMTAQLTFHTLSIPSEKVKLAFSLNNAALVCEHNDNDGSPRGDYPVTKERLPGQVKYTIG